MPPGLEHTAPAGSWSETSLSFLLLESESWNQHIQSSLQRRSGLGRRDGWPDLHWRPWPNSPTQLSAQRGWKRKKRKERSMTGLEQGDTFVWVYLPGKQGDKKWDRASVSVDKGTLSRRKPQPKECSCLRWVMLNTPVPLLDSLKCAQKWTWHVRSSLRLLPLIPRTFG